MRIDSNIYRNLWAGEILREVCMKATNMHEWWREFTKEWNFLLSFIVSADLGKVD